MKKHSAYYLIVCFFLCITGRELIAQTCFVKKIDEERFMEPLWTGPCKDSLATGEGILYDITKKMRYRGQMKIGLPDGYGAFYNQYQIEGTWAKGKPVNAGHFLREVRFNEEDRYVFIENGMRYLLNTNEGFDTQSHTIPAKPDTNGFAARLSPDTYYVPLPVKKKKRKIIPPPEYYASAVFYLDRYSNSGIFVSQYYTRFLVHCKYSGDWQILYFTEGIGKRAHWSKWQTEPFAKPYATEYKNAKDALKALCFCD